MKKNKSVENEHLQTKAKKKYQDINFFLRNDGNQKEKKKSHLE